MTYQTVLFGLLYVLIPWEKETQGLSDLNSETWTLAISAPQTALLPLLVTRFYISGKIQVPHTTEDLCFLSSWDWLWWFEWDVHKLSAVWILVILSWWHCLCKLRAVALLGEVCNWVGPWLKMWLPGCCPSSHAPPPRWWWTLPSGL